VANNTTVYLVVHELFGVSAKGSSMHLVTPDVKDCPDESHTMHQAHTYKIGRFKNRVWLFDDDAVMQKGRTYELRGVSSGSKPGVKTISYRQFNAHPEGKFAYSNNVAPYCQFVAPLPKKIHQLRLLTIPQRPLFKGKDGNKVEKKIKAISLVQAFEYVTNGEKLQIVDDQQTPVKLDYGVDSVNNTINLHLWASIEDESGMDNGMATAHAKCATKALVRLFEKLDLQGTQSLSVDDWYSKQLPMPDGLAFVELMTLAERFEMLMSRSHFSVDCSAKTCGHGSNLYIDIP
jgi:hypothetical protein